MRSRDLPKGIELARAGALTFGGQVAVVGALAASVGCCAARIARGRRPGPVATAGLAACVAYIGVVEPWMRHWGTYPAGRDEPLPGDDAVPDPGLVIEHAVAIEAPAERVWPWLAQIGQERGGFYSYAWLENLAGCRMRNADRIHPEWQRREVGDEVMLHPLAPGMPVTIFDPPRALGLEGWGVFVLEPLGADRTRLVVRGRIPKGRPTLVYRLTLAIPHFVMERKMLLGIKRRAEADPA
ncbi:MAG: SRPBCC family protein [Actinobacteria bacterium]|nr:SRPBCC family protein [Actinomycetota bacterium]